MLLYREAYSMAEPYTIHILVVDGDPGGVKIVDR